MEGLTSPREQERLHRLLMADDLPEEYLPYREMFTLLAEPTVTPSDEELTAFARDNGLELSAPSARRIALKPWLRYAGIAASFVLVFLAGQWTAQSEPTIIVQEVEKEKLVEVTRIEHDTVTVEVPVVVYKTQPQELLTMEDAWSQEQDLDYDRSVQQIMQANYDDMAEFERMFFQ